MAFASAFSCTSADLLRFEYRQRHMGTEARLVFFAPDSAGALAAASAAFDRIAQIDGRLSDYRADSEVAHVAAAEPGAAVRVSGDFAFVLSRALAAARLTDGAYDPTAGPVVALWREARRTNKVPARGRRAAALAKTGWRNVAIDNAARTVRPAITGLRLDFGGIAKGWAADQAVAVLAGHGITSALVEFGGEIVATGPPPGQDAWRIRIENGAEGDMVPLVAAAISTSGDAEQHVVIAGVRYSHVVDPRTGFGLTGGRSATVRASAGWLADLLATAATVADSAGLARLREAWPEATITVH